MTKTKTQDKAWQRMEYKAKTVRVDPNTIEKVEDADS